MRTTISDIAREAGVSTATVDRVLNNREGVHGRTRDRVLTTAQRLGYIEGTNGHPTAAAAARLDFILPGGPNTFINLLAGHLEGQALARGHEIDGRVHRIGGFSPEALAQCLESIRGHTEGVAVIALDHPIVREALRTLAADGVPVVTLASDIANVPRLGYVGIDNRAAGRLAGHLLGRFVGGRAGRVALFAGSLSYRGHEEREMGFRHLLGEDFPALALVETREVRDEFQRSYEEAKTILAAYSDVRGIYNIGGGNRGIARALEEAGLAREVVFIGHELTEHTRRFLLSGTMDAVIDQNPRVEARETIDLLLKTIRGEDVSHLAGVRTQVIFRENIPEI